MGSLVQSVNLVRLVQLVVQGQEVHPDHLVLRAQPGNLGIPEILESEWKAKPII